MIREALAEHNEDRLRGLIDEKSQKVILALF